MMKNKGMMKLALSAALASASIMTTSASGYEDPAACKAFGFCDYEGKKYWYEDGVRQGMSGDEKNIWDTEYNQERGREIYDPDTDAWYWLDAEYEGAVAYGKEVWMPYIFQDEDDWSDERIRESANEADEGLAELVYQAIINKNGKWVRYDEEGKMLKGWVTIEEKLYELYPGQIGNTYYYDHKTGIMAKGYMTIDSIEYHFDEETGALIENETETREPSQIEDGIYDLDPGHITIDPDTKTLYMNNIIIVVFEPEATDEEILSLIQGINGRVVGKLDVIDQYQIEIPGRSLDELKTLIKELEAYDYVQFAHYDMLGEYDENAWAPNDAWNGDVDEEDWLDDDVDGSNWWLEAIEAPEAWDHLNEMSNIKIGVVDAGFETKHNDLTITFPEDYGKINRPNDHGTHVAGIIGANADNNGEGITGVCPNSDLLCFTCGPNKVRLFGKEIWQIEYIASCLPWNTEWNPFSMIMSGFIVCVNNGAKVINVSVGDGGISFDDRIELSEEQIEYYGGTMSGYMSSLLQRGFDFVVVQAAGNEEQDAINCGFFASITRDNCLNTGRVTVDDIMNRVLIVAAAERTSDGNYRAASYSNGGSQVNIAAPGGSSYRNAGFGIYSTLTNDSNSYGIICGTSMAAPMVSGVCGLVWSLNPDFKGDEVADIVKSTSTISVTGTTNEEQRYLRGTSVDTRMVNARYAVEEALRRKDEQDVGSLTGKVCKASDRTSSIPGAKIHVYKDNNLIATQESNGTGNYDISLPSGRYRVEISADGYIPFSSHENVAGGAKTYTQTYLMVEGTDVETGTINGMIKNAVNGAGIEDAEITVRRGWNASESEETVETTETDSKGMYNLTLPLGNYTLHVTKEGYIPVDFNVIVQNCATSDQDASMSPTIENGQYRIVLTWDRYPTDLDSHLVGHSDIYNLYHVYFGDKNAYDEEHRTVCDLDVDDTTSYGPETVTLQCTTIQPYYYFVHNYSGNGTFANSQAQVKVYYEEELLNVFNVPTDQEDGSVWNVFAIKDGRIVVCNKISDSLDVEY